MHSTGSVPNATEMYTLKCLKWYVLLYYCILPQFLKIPGGGESLGCSQVFRIVSFPDMSGRVRTRPEARPWDGQRATPQWAAGLSAPALGAAVWRVKP